MNPQHLASPYPPRKLRIVQATLLTTLLAVCGVGLVSSMAQSGAQEEREFKNTIPAHVPIKVRVKNEQSFKDMKNKNWARELEIEVKNTGDKPIYYLYVIIVMPDVLVDGNPAAFLTDYGRKELASLEAPILPEDMPIRPGEGITLKIRENQVKGYEKWIEEEKKDHPKKIEFDMQTINFGDGTGFRGKNGRPDNVRKQSRSDASPKSVSSGCPPTLEVREADSPGKFLKATYFLMPASFLRVNFSPPNDVLTSSPPLQPSSCDCQNTLGCMWGYHGFPSCPCDEPFEGVLPAGGCADPRGRCLRVRTISPFCDTQYYGQQRCQHQEFIENCAITDPTPTPTPTPTPVPSPTPVQCTTPRPRT